MKEINPLIDIKKVADGSPYKVTRATLDYGYDIQAAAYCELFGRDRFILMTVEDEPPYDVVPYELSPGWIRSGRRKLYNLIDQVLECEKTGIWPGRSAEPVLLEQPEWNQDETTVEV